MRQRIQSVFGLAVWIAAISVSGGMRMQAQNRPITTEAPPTPGFQLPTIAGTLRYSGSISERITPDYNSSGTTVFYTNFSGNAAYISPSVDHSFSMIYSGGYLATNSQQPSSFFHTLDISQAYNTKRWQLLATDTVDYLPTAPVVGFAGVPGIPVFGTDGTDTGALSNYGPRLTNRVSGSATRGLTGRSSVTGTGTMSLQRFVGSQPGIENNQISASGQYSHGFADRSQIGVSYTYARQSYLAYPIVYNSQGVTLDYSRQWTRAFKTDFSAGPQRTVTSSSPSTLNYTINATADYVLRNDDISAGYVRAVNSGSGVTLATRTNTARASIDHRIGRYTNVTAFFSYLNSNTLPSIFQLPLTLNTYVASVQAQQSISHNWSGYVSYTAQRQSNSTPGQAVNALSGLQNTIGIGVTYSPRPIHLGR